MSKYFINKLIIYVTLLLVIFFALPKMSLAATYYLDADNGDDGSAGTISEPWQTLAKAQAVVDGGDTVYLSTGNYGAYVENTSYGRTSAVTYQALPNNTPALAGVELYYSAPTSVNIIFKNLLITSATLYNLVTIANASDVTFSGCTIYGANWYYNANLLVGVNIAGSENITIGDSYIHEVGLGVQFYSSGNVNIEHNHIKVKAGTAIRHLGLGTGSVIKNNHIHGESVIQYPEDPLAPLEPHQSAISIRGDNITISNNLFYDLANGIMTYTLDSAGGEYAYDNILIENNSIFNIKSAYGIRFYDLGNNVIVRNNTVASLGRVGTCDGFTIDSRYRYNTALAVHTLGAGSDGSGLSLYNNIFIGIANFPATAQHSNNIYWSLTHNSTTFETVANNSIIITSGVAYGCEATPMVLEDGTYFSSSGIDFFFTAGGYIDFPLSATSPAIDFGDPILQSSKSLGVLGQDGFLRAGIDRDMSLHSAGAYEFVSGDITPPVAPINLSVL